MIHDMARDLERSRACHIGPEERFWGRPAESATAWGGYGIGNKLQPSADDRLVIPGRRDDYCSAAKNHPQGGGMPYPFSSVIDLTEMRCASLYEEVNEASTCHNELKIGQHPARST